MATEWTENGKAVGVVGAADLNRSLVSFADGLSTEAARIDAEAAAEMVAQAKSNVPVLSGLLESGIESVKTPNGYVVQASAQKYSNTKDYAKDVEFGTAAGGRGRRVASDDYFSGPYSGRRGSLNEATQRRRRADDARRKSARTHPGTPAQPYFLPAVAEVMQSRNEEMAEMIDNLGDREKLL